MEPSAKFQRVGFLAVIPSILRDHGVDPSVVLRLAGLAETALDNPEATIPFEAMGRLTDEAGSATKCSHFGLLVGERITLATMGIIGDLMRHATCLRAALHDLTEYQHRYTNGGAAYFKETADGAILGYAIYQPCVAAVEQINDGATAAAFGLVRELLQGRYQSGMQVLLTRPRPADISPYLAFFGTMPRFETGHSGVVIPSNWLDHAVPGANAHTRKTLESTILSYRLASEDGIVDQVRRAVAVQLQNRHVGGDQIAAGLLLSRRTLDRRLASEGTGYQKLLDESRFVLACQLLAGTRMSIREIGVVVGLEELSVFSRAFARWSGLSPIAWRQSKRERR